MFDAITNDFYIVDTETGEERGSVVIDEYDPYTGKYAFVSPDNEVDDKEYDEATEDAHNGLIRGLIDASRDVANAKALLVRALDQLYLLGYDSGFTNPAVEQLVTDIKFYLNGGKLNETYI